MYNPCKLILGDLICQPTDRNVIQESLSLEPGPLRDAMHKLFTEILPCSILPALGQYISQARKLGIVENQTCLACRLGDIPENLLPISYSGFYMLSGILRVRMCASQNFFQALCTRAVEATLLRILWKLYEYVFIFEFWK